MNWLNKLLSRLKKTYRGVQAGDTVLLYWNRSASLSPIPGTEKVSLVKVLQVVQWTGYKTYYVELSPGDCIWVHEAWVE